jgi:putative polyhydroxyalkanoate system protein
MPDIKLRREHTVEMEEMRSRVQDIVEDMHKKIGVAGSWNGDVCTVSGKGIKKCEIRISPSEVSFEVTLGMMFKMMKGQIEKQLGDRIEKLVKV